MHIWSILIFIPATPMCRVQNLSLFRWKSIKTVCCFPYPSNRNNSQLVWHCMMAYILQQHWHNLLIIWSQGNLSHFPWFKHNIQKDKAVDNFEQCTLTNEQLCIHPLLIACNFIASVYLYNLRAARADCQPQYTKWHKICSNKRSTSLIAPKIHVKYVTP